MIGICEKSHTLLQYMGQSQSYAGWSYYGNGPGYRYHNGTSFQYGKGMKVIYFKKYIYCI